MFTAIHLNSDSILSFLIWQAKTMIMHTKCVLTTSCLQVNELNLEHLICMMHVLDCKQWDMPTNIYFSHLKYKSWRLRPACIFLKFDQFLKMIPIQIGHIQYNIWDSDQPTHVRRLISVLSWFHMPCKRFFRVTPCVTKMCLFPHYQITVPSYLPTVKDKKT